MTDDKANIWFGSFGSISHSPLTLFLDSLALDLSEQGEYSFLSLSHITRGRVAGALPTDSILQEQAHGEPRPRGTAIIAPNSILFEGFIVFFFAGQCTLAIPF